MPKLVTDAPHTDVDAVTEILHGIPVSDSYRWLEDQESPQTRAWIDAQQRHARSYFEAIPERDRIRRRVAELLDVETYDSLQKVGQRYFFRKRLRGREQPGIFFRESPEGPDRLLLDPAERGTGRYTAIKPLRVSPNGSLLLYEVKEGGERSGRFELLNISTRTTLPDMLPRGYLRGFAFAPDSKSFYYVHELLSAGKPNYRAVYHHVLGRNFANDQEIFFAGDNKNLRLHIVPGRDQLGFLVIHLLETNSTDLYLWPMGNDGGTPQPVIQGAEYKLGPVLHASGRIFAITDHDAPNYRLVEVRPHQKGEAEFVEVVPEGDAPIQNWIVAGERIFVSYLRELRPRIAVFDLTGKPLGQLSIGEASDTVRMLGASDDGAELFYEGESFTEPIQISRMSADGAEVKLWAKRTVPFEAADYSHTQVWFPAKDGTRIPMFLVGRPSVLEDGCHPTIMTSYGGYGIPMTPQFSAFVAFLLERGCLFALPNIRGGSEFGVAWHQAAKRQHRQVAFDDFLSAAEWLIETGRSTPKRLAIFGGSNSGLLVGAAMTQRPELFRAVICLAPMLDMLRYHRFDNAHLWKEEFGTAEDAKDFAALHSYSPYHRVREGTAYPATLIISGDADQNCNPLHARKMTARLQAANVSEFPILLDYSRERGHSPVLPLGVRIDGLTDRLAFICDQLQLET